MPKVELLLQEPVNQFIPVNNLKFGNWYRLRELNRIGEWNQTYLYSVGKSVQASREALVVLELHIASGIITVANIGLFNTAEFHPTPVAIKINGE